MMREYRVEFILITIAISCLFLYFWTSMPRSQVYQLTTSWDKAIPLIPLFVIPYTSFHYFLLPMTLGILLKQPTLYQVRVFLVSSISVLLLSNFIFIIFPTYFPLRPMIENISILHRMINFVYLMDNPYALCPSVHVNISILCAIMWWQLKNRYSLFMILWSILIVFSTLFIRQHYIIDVVAGVITAFISYNAGKHLTKKFLYDKGI